MNEIIFNKNISKSELLSKNIVIDDEAEIEDGVIICSNVIIYGKSKIMAGCRLEGFSTIICSQLNENVVVMSSRIENSCVGANSSVGPFAHLRGNANLGKNNRIGNFVEIKNSTTGDGVKIAHLTYVGDASIGNNCNIGCGVVFCNYNGKIKQKSIIGNNVFIGSNVNLIAPLKIGDEAFIAAGSTINKDVGDNQFAIAREKQTNKENFKNPYIDGKNY